MFPDAGCEKTYILKYIGLFSILLSYVFELFRWQVLCCLAMFYITSNPILFKYSKVLS